jgi:DNA replication and repair protein RecF
MDDVLRPKIDGLYPRDNNQISSLRLLDFRSYSDFAVELSSGVNIVVGPNASGKTNLMEAVLVVSGLKPYRASWADLISFNKQWTSVDCLMAEKSRSIKIKNENQKIEKYYLINSKQKKRLSLEDKLAIVLFEPENMRLLTDSPEYRRNFLDYILSQTIPAYSSIISSYKRTLAQRNHLLKNTSQPTKEQLFVWNIRLSEIAGEIVKYRVGLIKDINQIITEIYSEIAGESQKVVVSYKSKLGLNDYKSSLLNSLEKDINLDTARGFTGSGPHREDFEVSLRDNRADISASRGETRTIILSLKIIEKKLIELARGVKPIILLDDVFSELDGSRRKQLTKYLENYQTIITTTDADIISKNFAQHTNLISL